MSTPNVEVLGVQVTAGGGLPVQVPGVDVLAFTGTGPGTLPLAIVGLITLVVGLITLVVGLVTTMFGGRRRDGEPIATGPLRDLSHLAHGRIRELG